MENLFNRFLCLVMFSSDKDEDRNIIKWRRGWHRKFDVQDLSYMKFPFCEPFPTHFFIFEPTSEEKKRFNFCFSLNWTWNNIFLKLLSEYAKKKGWKQEVEKQRKSHKFSFCMRTYFYRIFHSFILEINWRFSLEIAALDSYIFRLSFHTSWYTAHEKWARSRLELAILRRCDFVCFSCSRLF